MTHRNTKKSKFLWDLVDLSYTMECEPEEWEALQLERYINQERNPELREALEDLDEFLLYKKTKMISHSVKSIVIILIT